MPCTKTHSPGQGFFYGPGSKTDLFSPQLERLLHNLKGKRVVRAKIISSQAGGCSTPMYTHTLQKNTRGLVRSNKRTCACHLPATQHGSTKPQRHPELIIPSSMSESLETTPGDRFHQRWLQPQLLSPLPDSPC